MTLTPQSLTPQSLTPQSMLRRLLTVAAVLTFSTVLHASSDISDITLQASLSRRTITVYQGDEALQTYGIAVGQDQYPTPTGDFLVDHMIWNPAWVPPPDSDWAKGKERKDPGDPDNPMKVVKIFFQEPDYYIHGTGDEDSIGQAASHGCMRMAPKDVAALARVIMEHGGQPRQPSWFRRIFHRAVPDHIQLTKAVPLHIEP